MRWQLATLISPSKLFYLKLTVNNLPIFTPLLPAFQNWPRSAQKTPISASNICWKHKTKPYLQPAASVPREQMTQFLAAEQLGQWGIQFLAIQVTLESHSEKGTHSNGSTATQIISGDRKPTTVQQIVADKRKSLAFCYEVRRRRAILCVPLLKTAGRSGGGKKMRGCFVANDSEDKSQTKKSWRSEIVGGFASTPKELVRIHKLAVLLADNLL